MVFDKLTGKCINRPFHKFFNINGELEECSSKNIKLKDKEHYWLEKLDGSMVRLREIWLTNNFKGHSNID